MSANPKQRYGDKKPNLALLTPAMEYPLALALMDGAGKYGPFNWRINAVEAITYIAAAKRHLGLYLEGEEIAQDGVHHLGHVMACCAILLDAKAAGKLIDNRPTPGSHGVQEEAEGLIQKLRTLHEERKGLLQSQTS